MSTPKQNQAEASAPSSNGTDEAAREQEHVEQLAQAHAALAAAQDRSYWLDRWGIDLNELMRRPGARHLQLGARIARRAKRLLTEFSRRTKQEVRLFQIEAQVETGDDGSSGDAPFRRSVPPRRLEQGPVTKLLFDRLKPADVKAVEKQLRPDERAMVDGADPIDRERLLLSFGVHHEVPAVLERTGLTPAMPPSDVHAMGRGSAASGGSPYYADLIVDALASAGVELASGMRGLDFGCSSGRAVRVMAAAHPECEWHGCDPIGDAIKWAKSNLEGIAFEHSPEEPPLPYDSESFDLVFAISIWSHFAERAGLAWLEEMHRVLQPGGALLMTTHGFQTIAHDHQRRVRSAEQLEEVRDAMYTGGFWFKNEFGESGDHGVANADWGTAFLTPEWLLANIGPGWRVAYFAPGRVEDNQDLYVLERR